MPHPLDPSNLHQTLCDIPKHIGLGFDLAKGIRVSGEFRSVVVSGMGGSASPGDVLAIFLRDLTEASKRTTPPISLMVNRTYSLPPESYHGALNFFSSFSGNTEETLSSFEEAIQHQIPSIAVSAGGKLELMAREAGVPHIKIPLPYPHFQPRTATGYFVGAFLQVLMNQGMIPDIRSGIIQEAEALQGQVSEIDARGKQLSELFVGTTPIIYTSDKYRAVAMKWKIKFNENAKTPAFWNYFPELNHNEMVGWTMPKGKFQVLMLRDPGEHPQVLKRLAITADLLEKKGVAVKIIDMVGEGVYTKVFGSLLLGEFTSYYLALLSGQDPTPVAMVEDLKKLLA